MDYVWEDSWLKTKISIAVPKVCHSDISESHSSLMWHRLTKINLIELTWFKTREPRPFRYIRTSLGKGKKMRGKEEEEDLGEKVPQNWWQWLWLWQWASQVGRAPVWDLCEILAGSPRSHSPSSVCTAHALVSSGASGEISTGAWVLCFKPHLSCS